MASSSAIRRSSDRALATNSNSLEVRVFGAAVRTDMVRYLSNWRFLSRARGDPAPAGLLQDLPHTLPRSSLPGLQERPAIQVRIFMFRCPLEMPGGHLILRQDRKSVV